MDQKTIRMCYWKQWKKISSKHEDLVKLGADDRKAWEYANTRKSYWHIANSFILATSITNEYLEKQGFLSLTKSLFSVLILMNRRIPNGTYGGVRGR